MRQIAERHAGSGNGAVSDDGLLLHVAALAVLCGGLSAAQARDIAKAEAERLGLHCAGGPGHLAQTLAAGPVVRP